MFTILSCAYSPDGKETNEKKKVVFLTFSVMVSKHSESLVKGLIMALKMIVKIE